MKTVKRLLALAGATLLIVSLALMTGCSGRKAQENVPFDFPYERHIELSWWFDYDETYFGSAFSEMEDHPFMKRMEEETNVSISFQFPTAATHIGEAKSELEAVMAAGETPDMVSHSYYCVSLEGNTLDSAIEEEIYLPLNEYIDVQMPNFQALMEQYSMVGKITKTQQENILYIPMLSGITNYNNLTNTSGLVIRKDFLEELQMDVPVTVDDWYEVLSAFKNQLSIDIPLVAGSMIFAPSMDHDVFITCYDQRYELYLDSETGKVAYGAAKDGVKSYVMMMNQWVKEGIAVQTDASEDMRVSDEIGAWVGSAETIMRYQSMALNSEYELVACPDPVLKEGDVITYHANNALIGDKNANSIFLSWNCSEPAIAAKWIDQLFSEEKYMEASYGVKDEDYTVDAEGNITFTEKVTGVEGGTRYGIAQNCFLESLWRDPTVIENHAFDEAAKAACEVWSVANGQNCLPSASWLQFTEEESDNLAELDSFWNLQMGSLKGFISGEKDITEWDDYVASMMDAGLEEYISIYQNAYDRYLAS